MGWGEPHQRGAGTTGQIEDAHRALDGIGVAHGPLAVRVLAVVGRILALSESHNEHAATGETLPRSDGSRATSDDKACPTCGHWQGLHNADGCTLSTCQCTTPGGDQ